MASLLTRKRSFFYFWGCDSPTPLPPPPSSCAYANMFHSTYKSIHSFIRRQIKDGDGHSFAVILSELADSDDEKLRRGKT